MMERIAPPPRISQEVARMPRYQITRVYLVERATPAQALSALDQPDASQYLAHSSIEEVPEAPAPAWSMPTHQPGDASPETPPAEP
jgi:hypothetical protein